MELTNTKVVVVTRAFLLLPIYITVIHSFILSNEADLGNSSSSILTTLANLTITVSDSNNSLAANSSYSVSIDANATALNASATKPPTTILLNEGDTKKKGDSNQSSDEALINRSSVLFVAVSFILLMIISLAWLVFYYVQRFRYLHSKERVSRRLAELARKAVARVPVKTLHAGDQELVSEAEQCAICIEAFRLLDNVRVLPCRHCFHKVCIDPWLLEQRSCPMCKLDILQAYGLRSEPMSPSSTDSVGGLANHASPWSSPAVRQPLLTSPAAVGVSPPQTTVGMLSFDLSVPNLPNTTMRLSSTSVEIHRHSSLPLTSTGVMIPDPPQQQHQPHRRRRGQPRYRREATGSSNNLPSVATAATTISSEPATVAGLFAPSSASPISCQANSRNQSDDNVARLNEHDEQLSHTSSMISPIHVDTKSSPLDDATSIESTLLSRAAAIDPSDKRRILRHNRSSSSTSKFIISPTTDQRDGVVVNNNFWPRFKRYLFTKHRGGGGGVKMSDDDSSRAAAVLPSSPRHSSSRCNPDDHEARQFNTDTNSMLQTSLSQCVVVAADVEVLPSSLSSSSSDSASPSVQPDATDSCNV